MVLVLWGCEEGQTLGEKNLLVHQSEHELFTHTGHLNPNVQLLVPLRGIGLVHNLGIMNINDICVQMTQFLTSFLHGVAICFETIEVDTEKKLRKGFFSAFPRNPLLS